MELDQENILNIVRETQILLAFGRFSDKIDADHKERQIIINMIDQAKREGRNPMGPIFKDRFGFVLNGEDECNLMFKLVTACLKKSKVRKQPVISDKKKKELISLQNGKCVICGDNIDTSSPVDHIVPFKYVGDELDNNYQILCQTCNSRKKESLSYQVEIILQGGFK